jgi:FkbM family methyltransferase
MQIFIDLGSHFGAIIRKFMTSKSCSPSCKIYAFEPSPVITEETFSKYPKNVIIYKKVAWVKEGMVDFFINKNPKLQGSSVCKEKKTGKLDKEHPIKIECMDFGKWLKDNFSPNDDIILKMNIEGAEYTLLPRMVEDGSIKMIKKLYLFHHWYKIKLPKSADEDIMSKLSDVPGLTVINDEYSF